MRFSKSSMPGWVTLGLLMGVVAVGNPQATSIAPFTSEIATALDVPVGRVGQLATAHYVGAFLACVLLTPFIERLPLKGILCLSAFTVGITTILTASLANLLVVFSLRLVAGAATGLILAGTLAAVGREWSDPRTRIKFTGFVVGSMHAGPGLVTPVLRIVAGSAGWHLAFYAYGLLSLIVAGLVFIRMPSMPGTPDVRIPNLAQLVKDAALAASLRSVGRTLLLAAVLWGVWVAIPILAPGFLLAMFPGQDGWIAPMWAAAASAALVTSLYSGHVISKLGGPRIAILYVGVLLQMTVAGFLWVVVSPGITVLILTLAGFLFGLCIPALVALLREFGGEHQGPVVFTYGAVQQAAGFVGATLWGVTVELSGFAGFQVALTLGSILPVAVLILLLPRLRERVAVPVSR